MAVIPSITGATLEFSVKTTWIAIFNEEIFSRGHIVINAVDRDACARGV
jgi:hypothetical protein